MWTHYKSNEIPWISGFLPVKGSESLGSKGMTPIFHKWRWFWWLAAGVAGGLLAIAGAGWLREKREADLMRERHQRDADDLRMRIDGLGDGVSLADFRARIPEASEYPESGRWTVRIPEAYDDEGMQYSSKEVGFLVVDDGSVKLDKAVGEVTIKTTIGCFTSKGLRYYFWRVWHSNLPDLETPPSG